jgi:hypothetical protein
VWLSFGSRAGKEGVKYMKKGLLKILLGLASAATVAVVGYAVVSKLSVKDDAAKVARITSGQPASEDGGENHGPEDVPPRDNTAPNMTPNAVGPITIGDPAPIIQIVDSNPAYNAWLKRGFAGSEGDFVNWVNTVQESKPTVLDNAVFDSATLIYNGAPQEIAVKNAPFGAEVHHANHRQTNIGTYRAYARVYKEGVGEKLLTAVFTIKKADITGVTLANATETFDGNEKKIEVAGEIPAGVTINYTINGAAGNGATNAGTYTVVAVLTGENFTDLTLTATLTIERANIEGLAFDDKTFEYDDTAKSIALDGELPAGTGVVYTNEDGSVFDGKTIPGSYAVKATITGANYNTLEMTATLTVDKAEIRGIIFEEFSTLYDGSAKNIAIDGVLPEGVSVRYTMNSEDGFGWTGATAAGVYDVFATLTGDYYKTLVLAAKLVIAPERLSTVTGLALRSAPTSDSIGANTVILRWDSVANAGSYNVILKHQNGDHAATLHVANDTKYDLKKGVWDILTRDNYNLEIVALPNSGDPNFAMSEPSEAMEYFHEARLAAPKNVRVEDGYLRWDAAPYAERYGIVTYRYNDELGRPVPMPMVQSDNMAGRQESIAELKKALDLKPGNKYMFTMKSSTLSNGWWNATMASDLSDFTDYIVIE